MATGIINKGGDGGRTVMRRPPVALVAGNLPETVARHVRESVVSSLQDVRRTEEPTPSEQAVSIKLMSFGFKYGLPHANYYFDVAFIRNPAREAEWNFFSEPTDAMRRFVLDQPLTQQFIERVEPLLVFLSSVDQDQIFAFGCNSGRHRSCILVEELGHRLRQAGINTNVIHRERSH